MGVYLRRSEEFLAEVLAPFEMMHRGFADTIHQLQEANATLEQRVDERTLALRESQRNTADLARLYLILSSINSAIVRLHDREELFKEACRIAVHQGGYPVAWVNMRDAADTGHRRYLVSSLRRRHPPARLPRSIRSARRSAAPSTRSTTRACRWSATGKTMDPATRNGSATGYAAYRPAATEA